MREREQQLLLWLAGWQSTFSSSNISANRSPKSKMHQPTRQLRWKSSRKWNKYTWLCSLGRRWLPLPSFAFLIASWIWWIDWRWPVCWMELSNTVNDLQCSPEGSGTQTKFSQGSSKRVNKSNFPWCNYLDKYILKISSSLNKCLIKYKLYIHSIFFIHEFFKIYMYLIVLTY